MESPTQSAAVVLFGNLSGYCRYALRGDACLAEEEPLAASPQKAAVTPCRAGRFPDCLRRGCGRANRDKPSSMVVAYTVDDALAKIREDGLDESDARGLLEMWVKGAMLPVTSDFVPSPSANQTVGPQRVLWLKGRMVVQTTEAGHRQVRDTLETIRKFGAAEVAIDVRFVRLDKKELKELLSDATALPVEAAEQRRGRCRVRSARRLRSSLGQPQGDAGRPGSVPRGTEFAPPLPRHGQGGGREVARACQDDARTACFRLLA